jgi:hypothetical protein
MVYLRAWPLARGTTGRTLFIKAGNPDDGEVGLSRPFIRSSGILAALVSAGGSERSGSRLSQAIAGRFWSTVAGLQEPADGYQVRGFRLGMDDEPAGY